MTDKEKDQEKPKDENVNQLEKQKEFSDWYYKVENPNMEGDE